MEVFSARLKWLREKNGITQKIMAEHLGISQPYYGRFEKNTGEPNLEALVKISSILNESTDFLLGIQELDTVAIDLSKKLDNAKYMLDRYTERLEKHMFKENNSDDEEFDKILAPHLKSKVKEYQDDVAKFERMFAVYVAEIPFSHFNGYGIKDRDGTIIFDPSEKKSETQKDPQ